jgi:phosphoribosylanthranilate isomerase
VVDAINAVNLGADAIGLVFYDKSPRAVSLDQAREIALAIPPFVNKVGLFVDATADNINSVLDQVPLDILQFHGDETAEQCRAYSKPYIKAVRMHEKVDLISSESCYSDAIALLLDAYNKDIRGGTGESFDWSKVPDNIEKPVILAGGLTADNVAEAIRQVLPYAVDVSSGVETDKGIKDATKIEAFIREVENAQ